VKYSPWGRGLGVRFPHVLNQNSAHFSDFAQI
jgi:hypothetical protein